MRSQYQRNGLVLGSRQNTQSLSSLQLCQSRIQTGHIQQQTRENETKSDLVDQQQQIVEKWIQNYQSANSNRQTIKKLADYHVNYQDNHICKLSLKQLKNVEIDSRMLMKAGPIKYQEYYFQFSLRFINEQNHSLVAGSEIYLSQCYRLDSSSSRQRYEFDQDIDFYFSFPSLGRINIQMDFFVLLSAKQKSSFSINQNQTSIIADNQMIGRVNIDLGQKGQNMYLLQEQRMGQELADDFNFQKKLINKGDQYVVIGLSDLQISRMDILRQLMSPLRIYTQQTKLVSNMKLGRILQNNLSRSLTNSISISLQIDIISISKSSISNVMNKVQQILKLKYNSISKVQSIEVKQYRLFVYTHNGEKLTSSTSLLLTKKQIQQTINKRNKNQNGSIHKNKKSTFYPSPKNNNTVNEKNYTFNSKIVLQSQSLAQLHLLTLNQNNMIVAQLFCKIQSKLSIQNQSRSITESFTFPVSYYVKPIQSINNDKKYQQKMIVGELLSPGGVNKYKQKLQAIKQTQRKNYQLQSRRNLKSVDRMKQKAESMSESFIEFYVFVQKDQAGLQRSTNRLMSQSDNLSQSFITQKQGRQMNKLIMQRARLKRQRQKIQQKINQYNMQNNIKIPLLDPTQIKEQYYRQNINLIRQQQYELQSTLEFLRNKIQQYEQKKMNQGKVQNQLIEDTLDMMRNQKDINIQGQKLIGAQGGNKNKKFYEQRNNQIQNNNNRVVIPNNPNPINFKFTIKNMAYLIKELNQLKTLIVCIKDFTMFKEKEFVKCIDVYGGIGQFAKLISGVQLSNRKNKQSNNQQIIIQLPMISPNLLLTFLFAPLTLYLYDHFTGIFIGHIFLYLSDLCSEIIDSQGQGNKWNRKSGQERFEINKNEIPILNLNKKKGTISLKLSTSKKSLKQKSYEENKFLQSHQVQSKSLVQQIEQTICLSQMSEQKRKMMRIAKFKRIGKTNEKQQNNEQKSQLKQSNKLQYIINSTQKQSFCLFYNSLSYKFIKVKINNFTPTRKLYKLSINDPDNKYTNCNITNQPIPSSQQIICVNKSPFNENENILIPHKQGQFQLFPNEKGTLIFQYFSKRDIFPPSKRKVQISQLNSSDPVEKLFLTKYNHKHNITTTITSPTGIEKLVNMQVNPVIDCNQVNLHYYFPFQEQFLIPLPVCSLITRNNIYFSHEQIQLLDIDGQWHLGGYAPPLNKVTILSVYVYPQPSILGSLAQQLQNKKNTIDQQVMQLITNIIYSEKVLHLSFHIWGCIKVNTFQLRLFQQTDVLWELDKAYLKSRVKRNQNQNDLYSICLTNKILILN